MSGYTQLAAGLGRLLAPNPSPMTGDGTHTYLVGTAVTYVVDPGANDAAHLQAIINHAAGTIKGILITHKHPDHTGGARRLSQLSGAPIYAHPLALSSHFEVGFTADKPLTDGQVFGRGDWQIEVAYTPGHSHDHCCFWLPQQRILLAGDTLMQGNTVVIIPPDGDMAAYFKTIQHLQTWPIKAILPAHGEVIDQPQQALAQILAHRQQREAQMMQLLSTQPASISALVAQIYPDLSGQLQQMAGAQVLAHLYKLEQEGRAVQTDACWRMV